MSDLDRHFHETWLGMVQPIDGLVVSIPVLVEAQCMERQPPQVQQTLLTLAPPTRQGDAGPEGHAVADLGTFFAELLGHCAEAFDVGDALPDELFLYVAEGKQTLRPTMGLKKLAERAEASSTATTSATSGSGGAAPNAADSTPAALAGARYEMLVWELPSGLDLDRAETVTGPWDYPPSAKLDRLLRHVRVPLGLLTNREVVRLIYAPHGESSGSITFRLDDMASVGGRPILDAFVMLLSANRFFGVTPERALPALLAESRKRQANVTNELAEQVFEALQILLRGFESAAGRDGTALLDDALEREEDHLYKGLLTVLLRLVFLLYAEDRALLPVEHPLYASHLSVSALFEELQADHGAYPDSMARRFGAWGRLVTVFRAVYLGMSHGDLQMPPRRGALFDPHEHPFLEGWGPAGSAPITDPLDRAAVKLPTVDDETVFRVLEKLLLLDGQRLSYRALDVEQIGTVYEGLMGYHALRVTADAVCLKPDRLWMTAAEVLATPPARRAKWLKETIGLTTAQADKLHTELTAATTEPAALEALAKYAAGGKKGDPLLSRARPGQLVLQPGTERRRTSSHYTPRSLSAPIVRRTLEPLLAVMREAPASERILNLKVCDPAMGSGAFLVEACRFLADHVLAAWTREGQVEAVAAEHGDPLLHARRLVAQRCLYGVDKNKPAVELAKLSLWLVTLSRTLPFTFLDHSLRHGDSLVGLDFDQIRTFHWKRPEGPAPKQLELFGREIAVALQDAIALRQKIGDLGDSPVDDAEKARSLWDAQDALERVRLIGDLVVGAFFAHEKDKDREAERVRRQDLVRAWLVSGEPPSEELLAMQRVVKERLPVFHWMVEFPEVFYAERPDPLDEGQVNRAAYMDAFVGNPPFLGQKYVEASFGPEYRDWLFEATPGASGRCDLCAFFFRQCFDRLGSHGTLCLIATNTIAQGDTRDSGLGIILSQGGRIYDARIDLPWPGNAAVTVDIVAIGVGAAARTIPAVRDGRLVASINASLESRATREPLKPLRANAGINFNGINIGGKGFLLDRTTYDRLATGGANRARLALYVGGEDVNSSPTHSSSRWVIDFSGLGRTELDAYPELLRIVEKEVRPDRDAAPDNSHGRRLKENWWLFREQQPSLRRMLDSLESCTVTSIYSKHLCFSIVGTDARYNNKVSVFGVQSRTFLAVLQSRLHESWARLLSPTMGAANTLAYAPSECFLTFPFPQPDPRAVIPALEDIGQRLYDYRAKYMVDENVGLTITYNRLKDPACTAARILELRRLHEEMDRAVIGAYAEGDPEGRWLDVAVPPYCPLNDADKLAIEAFGDAVIDRLFVLNAKRAKEEAVLGLGAAAKGAAKGKARAAAGAAAKKKTAAGKGAAGGTAGKAPKPKRGAGQLVLGEAPTPDEESS